MEKRELPHRHGSPIEDMYGSMPSAQTFESAAELMRQLGDATRMRIFWLLCHGEECVINISAMLGMTSPAVSHHLRLLRTAGLVDSSRKGKEVYYRVADDPRVGLIHGVIENIMQITCPLEDSGGAGTGNRRKENV